MGVGGGPPRLFPAALFFLLLFLALCCFFGNLRSVDAQMILPKEEVNALRQIAKKLKIPESVWNFNMDPCRRWSDDVSNPPVVSTLNCTCNATANTCSVISIELKGQNLTGVLPEEFGNLTSLVQIDLTRNYINGSIPAAAWSSLPLVNLTLLGNRLSGPIPKEIGKITTLQSLVLESNQLQGPLPPELGDLTSLNRLFLSANDFTGQLPETLGNLKNLSDFRIDGTDISGKITDFIGNWTGLQRLDMQGTSLEGPFPPIFSTLTNLTELRISDLKKSDGSFPPLEGMSKMVYLVLRNCSISGPIPKYIGAMSTLKRIDLSFNNLTGEIPDNFRALKGINNMYLTNSMLNGSIPEWILNSQQNIDVSYNNFTSVPSGNCQGIVNYIASYSPSKGSESNSVPPCFKKDLPCPTEAKNYKLFINCGGPKVTIDNEDYEEDLSQLGASTYFVSTKENWAYSNTGEFIGGVNARYIATNTSKLNTTDPKLYMSARLNPLSLRYFGLCLQKGNYTVLLHFAEIMFTDDQTFSSVGKRLFDVSIQGKKVLNNFNIAEAAHGTGRNITRSFTTLVEGSTLEIHFQWVGKGTNAIPSRGVYGPLISAISVTPNFQPKLFEDSRNNKLSVGAIVGIVAASCAVTTTILFFLWFCMRRKDAENNEFKGLELQTGYFSLKQIKAATGNFDPAYKIGEGGFGPVFKGVLPDGSLIAVKQLSSKSKQGSREFVNEIGMISALQHPNLVKLFGCCIEGNQLLLIYEYMENNSLARALFGPEGMRLKLDWQTRRNICLGISRGLAYLHEESMLKIVHRDIKATNVLLDKDLNPKISDFGLAKLDEEENTHISTRIAGTIGYMAPEYAMRGYLTDKADVYSFGVVTLEIVSGISNTNYRPKEEFVYLLDWAYVLQEQGSLLELVDASLGTDYSKEEAQQMLELALICTSPSPTLRPSMSVVVSMLEGRTPVKIPTIKRSRSKTAEAARFKAFEKLSYDSQTQSISMDGPLWVDSSSSTYHSKGDHAVVDHSSTSQLHSDITG